ncbi:Transposase [Caballeronia arationis]|jgi:transposase|uniref:Transposase n=2 Tax=Caballeronia arationis TaxID=1777142 RepID=A0A7Z7N132_9BURK|nr:Transposase [Caballeronia arationis]
MTHTIVGVDIAKNVMQVHWVDPETGEIVNKPVKRAAFLEYFANRQPCLIGMESCSGSQHWARRLIEMGHLVKLMPAKFVKAFNIRNKNDAADARAIWMATQMSSKAVAVKTEAQQAVLALHRMRQQLVKFRTMQINSLRGLLTEYGEVMGVGRAALNRAVAGVLERLSGRLPTILIDALREQWKGLEDMDQQIGQIERRLQGKRQRNPSQDGARRAFLRQIGTRRCREDGPLDLRMSGLAHANSASPRPRLESACRRSTERFEPGAPPRRVLSTEPRRRFQPDTGLHERVR